MISWRRQLPVHSPLDAAALFAGLRALAGRRDAQQHWQTEVTALLTECYGARTVLLTDSGTAALTATLLGVVQEAADATPAPVALPSYACYDVATAADGAGVPVLLYDIDADTLAPNLADVQRALHRGARAIVVAHLYGCPLDLTALHCLAANAGAIVIEDAAQAMGAMVHGRPAGSQGSLTVLSFGRGKGLTGGGGGAVLALDETGERVVERVRQQALVATGRRGWPELAAIAAQWLFQHPRLYAIPASVPLLHLGETTYRPPRPLRATAAVSCRIIASSWPVAQQAVHVRRRNAERLLDVLREQPAFQTITTPADASAGYLRLPTVASPLARRAAEGPEARRLGIMPGYPKALCDLPPFRSRCSNREHAFPGARLLAERLCTFPTHGRLGGRDIAALERWIRQWGNAT